MKTHTLQKLVAVGILIACSAASAEAAPRKRKESGAAGVKTPHTSPQIRQMAEPMLDNILQGFKFDDFNIYARDFEPSLKVAGSRTKFFEINRYMQNSLGAYRSRIFLGSVWKQSKIMVLWKGSFEKTPEDILIRLELAPLGKRYVVTGLWLE
ncbi:MAG: hypothetical protein NC924_05325 [Candidatus Omnitrophica bacterium]|nr:hypothetical protein [Candidatus Omnitrophota bacterium]